MRVVVVGRGDRGMLKGLTGRNLVVLEGTIDEVRAAAAFMLGEVSVICKTAAPPLAPEEPRP